MAPIEEKTEDLEKYLLDIEVRGEVRIQAEDTYVLFVSQGSDDSPTLKENAFFDPILSEVFGDYVTRCHSSDNRDFKHQFTVRLD